MGMDHYRRIRGLGGSSGAFLAVDKQDAARQVVIKRLADDAQGLQELMTALRVRHANIVPFLESFLCDGSLYLVMRYEPGGDLEQHLSQCAERHAPPDHATLRLWYTQLLSAVAHCHARRIIHRDIKPSNIFVSHSGRTLFLGDFGSAKTLDTHSITSTFVGSPMWLAPEVLLGKTYSYSADIWSLGCVFYEMAALAKPFACDSLAQLVNAVTEGKVAPLPPQLPPALQHLLARMLALDPAQRPSAAEALRLLQETATQDSHATREANNNTTTTTVTSSNSNSNSNDDSGGSSPPRTSALQKIALLHDVKLGGARGSENDSRCNAVPQPSSQTHIVDKTATDAMPSSSAQQEQQQEQQQQRATPQASRLDVLQATSQFATPPYARLNSAATPAVPMPSPASSSVSAAHQPREKAEKSEAKTASHHSCSTGVVVAVSPASSPAFSSSVAAAPTLSSASANVLALPVSRGSNTSSSHQSGVTRLSSVAAKGGRGPRAMAQTTTTATTTTASVRDARARSPGGATLARPASGVGQRRRVMAATSATTANRESGGGCATSSGALQAASPTPPRSLASPARQQTRPRSRASAGSKETTSGSEPRVVAKAPPAAATAKAQGRNAAHPTATTTPADREEALRHTPLVASSQDKHSPPPPPPLLQSESVAAGADGNARYAPPQLIIISPQKATAPPRRVRQRRVPPTAAAAAAEASATAHVSPVVPLRRSETHTNGGAAQAATPGERRGPAPVHPASTPPSALGANAALPQATPVSGTPRSLASGGGAGTAAQPGAIARPARYHRPRPRHPPANERGGNNNDDADDDDALRPSQWLAARNEDMSAIEHYLHKFRDYDDKVLLRLESKSGELRGDGVRNARRTPTATPLQPTTMNVIEKDVAKRSHETGRALAVAQSPSPARHARRGGSPGARRLSPSPAAPRRAGQIRQVSTKYAAHANARPTACSPFSRQSTAQRHARPERSPHSVQRAQHQASFARPAQPRTEQERQRSEEQRCAARARREAERSAMKAMIRHQRARARRPSRAEAQVAVEIRLPDNLRFTDSGAIRPLSRGQLEA